MGNMISGKEEWRPSFYEEFEDDRISGFELFQTVGGIEKSIVGSDDRLNYSSFEPMKNVKFPDDEPFLPVNTKIFPLKTVFYFAVRFFRTL